MKIGSGSRKTFKYSDLKRLPKQQPSSYMKQKEGSVTNYEAFKPSRQLQKEFAQMSKEFTVVVNTANQLNPKSLKAFPMMA